MADADAALADPRIVWHDDVLRFSDTDANGHINNTAFSTFCESGRVNLLRGALGPTRPKGAYFVIARLLIEYRAELTFPGRVRSGTWIRALGRTSVTFGQVLLRDDGVVAAISDAVTVSMDGETRRPVPMSEPTRDVALRHLIENAPASLTLSSGGSRHI